MLSTRHAGWAPVLLLCRCGARSELRAPERREIAPDVFTSDVRFDDAPTRDAGVDARGRACVWRVSREAPLDPGRGLRINPSSAVFASASGNEVWLGLVAGASPYLMEILHVGGDGAPLGPSVEIGRFSAGGGYFGIPQIALDPPRRAAIHFESDSGCHFVRFGADGLLAASVSLGRSSCNDLRTTPTGFSLWLTASDGTPVEHVMLDDGGAITRRTVFVLPAGAQRLGDLPLADGAMLVLWTEPRTPRWNTLQIQRFGIDGRPSAPATTLSGAEGTHIGGPAIAPTPDGFAVTWAEVTDPLGSGPVLLATLDARGNAVGGRQTLGTQTHRGQAGRGPTLTVSHGDVLVSWHQIDAAGVARIVVQPVPLDGSARPAQLALGVRLDPTSGSVPVQLVATPVGALLLASIDSNAATRATEIVALTCE